MLLWLIIFNSASLVGYIGLNFVIRTICVIVRGRRTIEILFSELPSGEGHTFGGDVRTINWFMEAMRINLYLF